MATPVTLRFTPGFRLINGTELNSFSDQVNGAFSGTSAVVTRETSSDSLVAFAGGGQASATLLPSTINRVATVASAADSVRLPPITSTGANVIYVANAGANSMQVFGTGTDTINAAAAATGVAQAAGVSALYFTAGTGRWYRNLSA